MTRARYQPAKGEVTLRVHELMRGGRTRVTVEFDGTHADGMKWLEAHGLVAPPEPEEPETPVCFFRHPQNTACGKHFGKAFQLTFIATEATCPECVAAIATNGGTAA